MPSLTATPDTTLARVELLAEDVGDVVVVTRTALGVEETVRGGILAETSGGYWIAVDDECPLGTQVTYTVYDPELQVLATASVVLAVARTWLKVPGEPSLSLPVTIGDHDRTDSYSTPTGAFSVVGSPYPLTISGTMSARVTEVVLVTLGRTEAAHLARALRSAPVILLETPTGHALARGYFSVSGVSRKQHSRTNGDDVSEWGIPLVEVATPSGVSALGGRQWSDIVETFETWQAVVDTYDSWLALVMDD